MNKILLKQTIQLFPNRSDDIQSAEYAFIRFDLPQLTPQNLFLRISFTSTNTVQLPFFVYDNQAAAHLMRSPEPRKGQVEYTVLFDSSMDWFFNAPFMSLVLHKRILSEALQLELSLCEGNPQTEKSLRKTWQVLADGEGFFDKLCLNKNSGWYCGELHVHSTHSTGRSSIQTIVRVAREKKLDFLALTDHATCLHWSELQELYGQQELHEAGSAAAKPPLFLRSMEVAGARGHANIHGCTGWVNPFPDDAENRLAQFLGRPIAQNMEAVADLVHEQGGLFCINHALSASAAWRYENFPLQKADLLEVACIPDGTTSFLYTTFWDRFLCQGLRLVGVGSSDSHDAEDSGAWALGRIKTWVFADELSQNAVLAALKKGRAYVSLGESRLNFTAKKTLVPTGRPSEAGRAAMQMGETMTLAADEVVRLTIELSNHPSGNVFVIKDGLVHSVHFLPASKDSTTIDTITIEVQVSQIALSGESYFRLEFHEDLEKARYHGMAYRDHQSVRLISNPLWFRRG